VLEMIQTKQRVPCCGNSLKVKFISIHAKLQMLHVFPTFVLLCCILLFSRSSKSNTDRQYSHYSDGSKLNSTCNNPVFLQHKVSIKNEACSNIYAIPFPRILLCKRIVEQVNLYSYYRWLQLLVELA
jgi:hypothetical protein